MSTLPKISVITPTLNAAKTLSRCIESVAQQTYPNKEHWIIDGLSTDETMDIVRQYAAIYPHIHFISEKDKGIYDAMNKGIQLSTGEWLYFLGADDYLIAHDVLAQIAPLLVSEKTDMVYGNVIWGSTLCVYRGRFEPHDLLRHNICHQAIFTKKSVLEELGGFDLKYPLIADYVTNLKIFLSTKYKITYIDKVIAYYGSLGKSYSPWSEEERNSFYSLRSKLWNEYCNKKILIYKKKFFAKIINFFRK